MNFYIIKSLLYNFFNNTDEFIKSKNIKRIESCKYFENYFLFDYLKIKQFQRLKHITF